MRRDAFLGLSVGALLGLLTAALVEREHYRSTGFILALVGSLVGCLIASLYRFLRDR